MNITQDTQNTFIIDNGSIFIMIAFMISVLISVYLFRIICREPKVIPFVQGVQVIEIPIASSISTQTVDNEHVGIVL